MPDNIFAGEPIDIAVTVESNVKASAELVLYSGEDSLSRVPVSVEKGTNSFFLTTTVAHAGVNTYRVELQSGTDTLLSNNRMYSYVNAARDQKQQRNIRSV